MWPISKFLVNLKIGQTFTSYDRTYCPNWLKWTVFPLKEWWLLRGKYICLKRSVISCKRFQRVHHEQFLNKVLDFRGIFSIGEIFTTFRICSNEPCLLRKGGQLLRGRFLYLKQSGIGCKKFQRVHPKHIFSFLRDFSIGQTFTSYNRTDCAN